MRFRLLVLMFAVAVLSCLGGPFASAKDPLTTGNFSWKVSKPLVKPFNHDDDTCYSIKDPTIVRYNGHWHLFCTIRSKNRTHQIEYCRFVDWKDANQAQRHLLNLTPDYYCAPQVFYFSPQKKWYLIFQVRDRSRTPSLQPAYSITDDVSDPASWSKPKLLFDQQPENVKMWIDFWIICDNDKAHLFFTSHAGWMWRSETNLSSFPTRWSKPEIALKGDIFEASHTYRLKGTSQFLTFIEAQDEGRRYFKAFTAKRLNGKWSPLANSRKQPFVSSCNVRFGGPVWTSSFSHGELLRSGYDEKLEVDPNQLQLLFQGVTSQTRADENYGKIPWRLGLLTLDHTNVPSK